MKIIIFLSLFCLFSCSQPSSINKFAIQENNLIELSPITILANSSGMIAPFSLDFGNVEYKKTVLQEVIISNNNSSSINYSLADFDFSNLEQVTVSSNSCIGIISSRKKCSIKLSVSNQSSLLQDLSISEIFSIKLAEINLFALKKSDPTDYNLPIANIVVSPLMLDFGSLKFGESRELSVFVKNNGRGSQNISVGSVSSANVIISSNSCSSLNTRSTCLVKLKYSVSSTETISNQNLIMIANNQVKFSVLAIVPSESSPEVVNISASPASQNINFTLPEIYSGSAAFVNNGLSTLDGPISAISSHSSLSITSVSCSSGLARGKSCTVAFTMTASAPGLVSRSLYIKSGTKASSSMALNFNVAPDPSIPVYPSFIVLSRNSNPSTTSTMFRYNDSDGSFSTLLNFSSLVASGLLHNNKVYYVKSSTLWVYDLNTSADTQISTALVSDLNNAIVQNNILYYRCHDGSVFQLCLYDTANFVVSIGSSFASLSVSTTSFISVAGQIFFTRDSKLYKYNPSEPVLANRVSSALTSTLAFGPSFLRSHGNKLYFVGGGIGSNIYEYDPSLNGPSATIFYDVGITIQGFIPGGDSFYYVGGNPLTIKKVLISNPSSVNLNSGLASVPVRGLPSVDGSGGLIFSNNKLYFDGKVASTPTFATEIWYYDVATNTMNFTLETQRPSNKIIYNNFMYFQQSNSYNRYDFGVGPVNLNLQSKFNQFTIFQMIPLN